MLISRPLLSVIPRAFAEIPQWSATICCKELSAAFTTLPVIDVGPLVNDEPDKRITAVASDLHQACKDVGFFYVINHGVPEAVSTGVLAQAHKWFALPETVKRQLLLRPETCYRGYQPLGANVTRHHEGFTPDWHEALDLYKEESPSAIKAAGHPASPIHGPNQWPCQVPGFTPILMDYIHHMQRLGAALLRGIAAGLGLPQQYFGGSLAGHEESYWVLRVIHYPPLQDKSLKQQHQAAAAGQEVGRQVQLSCGEHTDYGLLTLVNQDPHVCALQVKNALGQWVDAPPLPGTFVCNIGDMFQVLTNGQYKPTLHRVLNTDPSKSRVSVPFFYEPCYEAIVQPIPQFCRSAPAKYPAVRYGTHLESKVLTNFEM